MKRHLTLPCAVVFMCGALLTACQRAQEPAAQGVIQTKYPGQISAGGISSGEVMARTARPATDATYAGGTPGIAGGAGGNTGGATPPPTNPPGAPASNVAPQGTSTR